MLLCISIYDICLHIFADNWLCTYWFLCHDICSECADVDFICEVIAEMYIVCRGYNYQLRVKFVLYSK